MVAEVLAAKAVETRVPSSATISAVSVAEVLAAKAVETSSPFNLEGGLL